MNNKKKIIKAKLDGKEELAEIYEFENKVEEQLEKADVSDSIKDLTSAVERLNEKELSVNVEQPEIKVEVPEVKVPEIVVPTPEVTVQAPDDKETKTLLKKIAEAIKTKASEIMKVKVTNDFVPMRIMKRDNRGRLQEADPEKLFRVSVAGGGGPSSVGVKSSTDTRVNPATEETLQSVLEAQGGSVYNYIQSAEDATYKYYGFASTTGWKFKRKTLSTGVWEVADGTGDYDTAWADRANKIYDYI